MVILILVLAYWKAYISYRQGEKADAVFFCIIGTVLAAVFLLLSLA